MANPDISTVERSTIVSSFIKTWPNATVYYTLPSQGSLSTQAYNTFLTNINKAFDMISSKPVLSSFNVPIKQNILHLLTLQETVPHWVG